MRIRPGLLRYLLRRTLAIHVIIKPVLCLWAYTLLSGDVLTWHDPWPALFVLVHSLILAWVLSPYRPGEFAFLYSRGYSRDALWGHAMLAGLASILVVWLPAALFVWTGLRSYLHDRVFESANFPVMAPLETSVPLVWLAGYVLLAAVFHYAWIRRAQPTTGGHGATFLAAGLLACLFTVFCVAPREPWLIWLFCTAEAVVVVSSLMAGWRLHRRLEVQS